MNNIDKFLDAFKEEITKVYGANLVLAGSNVLMLHGLRTSWSPEDLDIAIYEPTVDQVKYIANEDNFEPCMSYDTAEELGIQQRAWKKTKDGLTLNFILEYSTPKPQVVLLYPYDGLLFQVNNIETIISAKLSYSVGEEKSFVRRKDAWHLSELKNCNFNVPKPTLPHISSLPATKKTLNAQI